MSDISSNPQDLIGKEITLDQYAEHLTKWTKERLQEDWRNKVEDMERIGSLTDLLKECSLPPSNAAIYRINPPIPQPGSILWYLQQEGDVEC